MKNIFLVIILTVSFFGFSQKIKLKNNQILVDDTAWITYQDCGSFDQTCSLLDKNKEELIFIKWIEEKGVEPITIYNKTGNLLYQEVKFLGINKFFEIQETQKGILKLLYNSKVINADGELDKEKVEKLIEKYGKEYSERLSRNSNKTNTIIIKEEPRSSGVNINIGR